MSTWGERSTFQASTSALTQGEFGMHVLKMIGALARAMGCYGEGPIDKPADVRPALIRALAEVKKGRCALVDTITQHS